MAEACPEYRLRLFMSVDLTGSTAYKARREDRDPDSLSPNPAWVERMRRFYRGFPARLATEFQKLWKGKGEPYPMDCPAVWKTVGDEIIFATRLKDMTHMEVCVQAFIAALKSYGSVLETEKEQLDVKGYAWTASFPYPNVTLGEAFGEEEAFELPDEETENLADIKPSDFDFLGKHIDCGFRISKFASTSALIVSIEVFYLLVQGAKLGAFGDLHFQYEGRQHLKGVIGDAPYPIFSLDTERNADKKSLRSREERLLPERKKFDNNEAWDFVVEFMAMTEMEVPVLPKMGEIANPPPAYAEYVASWDANRQEILERDKTAADAELGDETQTSGELALDMDQLLADLADRLASIVVPKKK
ncbi:hypothetical protein ABIB57_002984 [Devosia sp. UYZn731]|uniref:hypothetical protein n=1 Tax=Devosia sp. UYZn731 TaxID=3156345 RepID=UPI00339969A0